MENLDASNELSKESNPFAKYGLEFQSDGTIRGPKRPPLSSETPLISPDGSNLDLSRHKEFLEKVFKSGKFSITEDREELMDVVGKIFKSATDRDLGEYVNIIFMEKQDWDKFKPKIKTNVQIDEGKDFNAINLGGLVILGAEGSASILPTLFHEAGHSLYPIVQDQFINELRAFYFQRVCTVILQNQLSQLGLPYEYPDKIEDEMFASTIHKVAYQTAASLYAYQMLPEWLQDKVDPDSLKKMKDLSTIVKPDQP